MLRKKATIFSLAALVVVLLCGALALRTIPAQAQAPSDDPYEQNDSLVEASTVPGVVELPNMTSTRQVIRTSTGRC